MTHYVTMVWAPDKDELEIKINGSTVARILGKAVRQRPGLDEALREATQKWIGGVSE